MSNRSSTRWQVGAALWLLACSSGCSIGMSAAQRRCLQQCSVRNDRCLLYAGDPQSVQGCDRETSACARQCER